MRMIRRGSRGTAVKAWQRVLLEAGYPIGQCDGVFGRNTQAQTIAYQTRNGVTPDGIVGPATWFCADVALGHYYSETHPPNITLPGTMLDQRRTPGRGDKNNGARWLHRITGITLHQAGVELERQPRNPAFHFLVLRRGVVLWLRDMRWMMWQAQRVFNRTDVGIEFSGHYAGVEGDLSTYWRPPSKPDRMPQQLTNEAVAAGHDLIRWICAEVAAAGGRVRHLHAHRQTSESRRSDPGEAIWKRVALPMMDELQLDHLIGVDDGGVRLAFEHVPAKKHPVGDCWTTHGPGKPIPKQWDPRQPFEY